MNWEDIIKDDEDITDKEMVQILKDRLSRTRKSLENLKKNIEFHLDWPNFEKESPINGLPRHIKRIESIIFVIDKPLI